MAGKQKQLKLVTVGDSMVGKSSLCERYVNDKFSENMETTVGAFFFKKNFMDGNKLTVVHIWDTAGQERYQALGPMYFRGASVIVMVYDGNDQASINHLDQWHNSITSSLGLDIPIVVLRNKSDLPSQTSTVSSAQNWCKRMGYTHFDVSAKDGNNVKEAFEFAIKQGCSGNAASSSSSDSPTIIPSNTTPNSGCGCVIS